MAISKASAPPIPYCNLRALTESAWGQTRLSKADLDDRAGASGVPHITDQVPIAPSLKALAARPAAGSAERLRGLRCHGHHQPAAHGKHAGLPHQPDRGGEIASRAKGRNSRERKSTRLESPIGDPETPRL
jgi:hypothetical protein